MNRLLLGLMFLLTATAARAEWTMIGDGDNFILYVDTGTIRRNGDFVKMWSLVDLKTEEVVEGDSHLSRLVQDEYDCKEEMTRILAMSVFSGNMRSGRTVYTKSVIGKWRPVSPGSVGEGSYKIACGK